MFAIIKNIDNVTFENFPENYKSSPFFNLDPDIITYARTITLCSIPDSDFIAEDTTVNMCVDSELPSSKSGPTGLTAIAVECRETLGYIRSTTYLCQDIDSLKHLAGLLQVASDQIQTSCTKIVD